MSKVKASDVPALREALEAIADGEGDAVVIAQQTLDANPVADASKSRWRAECTECVGTGCSQTEAPCPACGGSGNVPGSEWRDTPQAAMADHLATRLEALQAQPVGEAALRAEDVDEIVRHACESASDDRNGEYFIIRPDALLKAAGEIAGLTASPPVVEREAIGDSVRDEWLRADWYERWQDATENADDSLMSTLESLRVRVERTILAALSTPVAQGDEVRDALEPLHFERAQGRTIEEMRDHVTKTDLYRRGDTILIWVNEGDTCITPGRFGAHVIRATLTKGARDAG